MFVKCAWCKLDMGEKPGQPETELDTTHTICPACKFEIMNEARVQMGGDMPLVAAPKPVCERCGGTEYDALGQSLCPDCQQEAILRKALAGSERQIIKQRETIQLLCQRLRDAGLPAEIVVSDKAVLGA